MSLVLESTNPSSNLLRFDSTSWPSSPNRHSTLALSSFLASMSSRSLSSFFAHIPASSVPAQELNNVPASTWYSPSILAPGCPGETQYDTYGHFIPSHTTAVDPSPPARSLSYSRRTPASDSQPPPTGATNTPSPRFPTERITLRPDSLADGNHDPSNCNTQQSVTQLRTQPHLMDRPRSSSSSLHGVPIEASWPMNPLGIHSPQESYYSAFPGMACSPRSGGPLMGLPSSHLVSPQPRRMYTPIAPQPLETPRSHVAKRPRDEDDEGLEEAKRRKRSDSTTSGQFELSEEDKLLLHLKDEESMPWKDIAARFQTELGKQYQIPALQMRLKRLRERMRVWTETDVRALRMAHEYWVQNKFDIIAQKMVEYGAQEKWTSRQCSRKWSEIEPTPAAFANHFEQHVHTGFAPYTMSPVEPSATYMPYLHAQ